MSDNTSHLKTNLLQYVNIILTFVVTGHIGNGTEWVSYVCVLSVKSALGRHTLRHAIWRFRQGVNKFVAILGCYAAQIGSYLTTFRNNLWVSS